MPALNDRETRIVEYVDANLHTIVNALNVYADHMESNATTAEHEYLLGRDDADTKRRQDASLITNQGYRRIVEVMRESRDQATKVASTLAQIVEAE